MYSSAHVTSTFPPCVLAAIYPLLLQKVRRANYLLALSQVPFRHWKCPTTPVNAPQPSEVAASPISVFQMGTEALRGCQSVDLSQPSPQPVPSCQPPPPVTLPSLLSCRRGRRQGGGSLSRLHP